MEDRISNLLYVLSDMPNPIKLGDIAHDNQQHDVLKYLT